MIGRRRAAKPRCAAAHFCRLPRTAAAHALPAYLLHAFSPRACCTTHTSTSMPAALVLFRTLPAIFYIAALCGSSMAVRISEHALS